MAALFLVLPMSPALASTSRAAASSGSQLPLALAELGLIDEYELVVHPVVAGHGPTLFAGLSNPLELELVDRQDLGSGIVAMRYVPRRAQK